MHDLLGSNELLQSKLFRTPKTEEVAFLKLIGLHKPAAVVAANVKRVARLTRLAEVLAERASTPDSEPEESGSNDGSQRDVEPSADAVDWSFLRYDELGPRTESEGSWTVEVDDRDNVGDKMELHPLLRSLLMAREPEGKLSLRIRHTDLLVGDLPARTENATHPPVNRVWVRTLRYNQIFGQYMGGPGDRPITVEAVCAELAKLVHDLGGAREWHHSDMIRGRWEKCFSTKGIVCVEFVF